MLACLTAMVRCAALPCRSRLSRNICAILVQACAGGEATSDWLQKNFGTYIDKAWQDGNAATMAITDAFVEVWG